MSTIQLNSKDFASQTSSAEPVIASTVTGSPALVSTNMTGQQLCKAWVNFSSVGTLAVADSFNVSSVVDEAQGENTVNFDTDMSNANYCLNVAMTRENTSANYSNVFSNYHNDTFTTSAFYIRFFYQNHAASGLADSPRIFASVFGDQ